jgi:hypothetical protein
MCNERHDDGPRRLALEPESTADKVGRVGRCKGSHMVVWRVAPSQPANRDIQGTREMPR